MALAIYVLSAVIAVGLGVVAWKKFYKWDHDRHDRQRAFAHLAAELRARGLVRLPEIFDELAFDDVMEFLANVYQFAKLAETNPEAVAAEFESLFERELSIRLTDPKWFAWIKGVVDQVATSVAKSPAA